ncbi:MAG: RidA family protein [Pseudomonadales bacterium]|nr:RidA family protein [Pseudomonadales bacterium]
MSLKAIQTDKAPAAIGPYSQAVQAGNMLYCSGQIPLIPETMELIEGDITAQTTQVFENLKAVASAAGTDLKKAAKINISLTDLNDFAAVNDVMEKYFDVPYPARACVQVAALPKGVPVEIEAIILVD